MILKRIAPLSLAKVFGLIYALMGLLFGALVSLLALVGALSTAQSDGDEVIAFVFGIGAILILPVFYGVLGAIGGFFIGLFYNLVARVAGGVEFEIEPRADQPIGEPRAIDP